MKIKKLVIGSKNNAKVEEWTRFLKDFVRVLNLDSFPKIEDIEEIGETFSENARLKSSYYAKNLEEFVFSEDGGFEIDSLGGLPGVHSRRILPGKKEATDREIVDFILEKLKGLPLKKRQARLKVAVAISNPKGQIIYEDFGFLEGLVLETKDKSKIMKGYPYRNLLYLPKFKKTYAEISDKDHNKINHKKAIAKKLKDFLLNYS